MSDPTEEEKLENTRRFFAKYKDRSQPMQWYHSVLDPEAKVIYNDKGEILIRDKQLWKDLVSNTWINPTAEKKWNKKELEI